MSLDRFRLFVPLLLSILCVATLPAWASERSLSLDPQQTEISFELGATGHDVHGIFHLTSGELGFDPETHDAWGQLEIDVRSGDTGNAKRDKTMHAKVLESESYPLVLFRADHIEGDVALEGESDFTLVGTMTLLGVEHPVSLETHAKIENEKVEATAAFDVPYVDWGLHDPSKLLLKVAKIVSVEVSTAGTLAAGRIDPESTGD